MTWLSSSGSRGRISTTRPYPISRYCPISMCCPMVRTLLKMRGRGDYSETYGYAEGLGVKTVGFRSNAPAGPYFRKAFYETLPCITPIEPAVCAFPAQLSQFTLDAQDSIGRRYRTSSIGSHIHSRHNHSSCKFHSIGNRNRYPDFHNVFVLPFFNSLLINRYRDDDRKTV